MEPPFGNPCGLHILHNPEKTLVPIKGPLRAVDTKVLGISLERTPLHGSALERLVFISLDAGYGHAESTLEFIGREGGAVVRHSTQDSSAQEPAFWDRVRLEQRSLDALVVSLGSVGETSDAAEIGRRTEAVTRRVHAAMAALRLEGGRVLLTFDVPAQS